MKSPAKHSATGERKIIGYYHSAPLKPKRFRKHLEEHDGFSHKIVIGDVEKNRCPICHAPERVIVGVWKADTLHSESVLCIRCGWAAIRIPRYDIG